MLNMKGLELFLWVKSVNDECSGCSLLERNLYQYGVHAKKIIVFCKTYDRVPGVHRVREFRFEEKNSEKVEKNSGLEDKY